MLRKNASSSLNFHRCWTRQSQMTWQRSNICLRACLNCIFDHCNYRKSRQHPITQDYHFHYRTISIQTWNHDSFVITGWPSLVSNCWKSKADGRRYNSCNFSFDFIYRELLYHCMYTENLLKKLFSQFINKIRSS